MVQWIGVSCIAGCELHVHAGHDNGSVVLWEMSHVAPQRLSTVCCGCKAAVTCMSLQEATGLLAAGHATGEVRCRQPLLRCDGMQPLQFVPPCMCS
jgi:hypothetical protein